jgi:hypothetical protein
MIPPRAGPVLESKLRRMHVYGDLGECFFVQGGKLESVKK